MNVLAPYENVTVLYGHIHREDSHTFGHAQHFAARSLIFAFPDPHGLRSHLAAALDASTRGTPLFPRRMPCRPLDDSSAGSRSST